jgi:hypothetical protein
MPQPETSVKRAIRRRLTLLPQIVLKPNPQQGFGVSGVCDIDGCWKGRYLGIEVKVPFSYEKPAMGLSESQVDYALRILAAGGLWMVVDSANRAEEHLRAMIADEDAYRTTWTARLREIKAAQQAKWSERKVKNAADKATKRQRLRPDVIERLAGEREQAKEDAALKRKIDRRFRVGKTPIPFNVLLYGLHGKLEEP